MKILNWSRLLSFPKVDAIVVDLSVIQGHIFGTGLTFDNLSRSIFKHIIRSAKHHGEQLTFWLTHDRRIKYHTHWTKRQKGLVTGFNLMRSLILDDTGQAFLIDETNKNTLQVSHFINIYLEQAISRKTDRTDVILCNHLMLF